MMYLDRTKVTMIGNTRYIRVPEAAMVNMGIDFQTRLKLEFDAKKKCLVVTVLGENDEKPSDCNEN